MKAVPGPLPPEMRIHAEDLHADWREQSHLGVTAEPGTGGTAAARPLWKYQCADRRLRRSGTGASVEAMAKLARPIRANARS